MILAIIPLIIAFFFGITTWCLQKKETLSKRWSYLGTWIGLSFSIYLFISIQTSGSVILQASDWPAPYGITFHIDLFSSIMILISYVLLLASQTFSFGFFDKKDFLGFNPLIHFLMMGVIGSFSTGDLFNLYVWFEVLLISSFALMAHSNQSLSSTVKYVVLNLVGSSFFLLGLGVLYNSTGTLNWEHLLLLSKNYPETITSSLPWAASLIISAFLIKSGNFPFYSWLPTSYPNVPAPILALFAGLLTKVGVYTIVRFFGLGFPMTDQLSYILVPLAGLTMLFGVWGAASQKNTKSILSFHIISQIGYMVIPLGLKSEAALAASIFYLIHHMIVKTNLFLVSGFIERKYGSSDLSHLGSIRKDFWIAFGFLIPAMSLAGIPPFSGFWAKLLVVESLVITKNWLWLFVSLFVGMMTLYSMSKIWSEAFQKKNLKPMTPQNLPLRLSLFMLIPILILCIWTIAIGLFPSFFYEIALEAAREITSFHGGLQ